jgi:hypothetical protein
VEKNFPSCLLIILFGILPFSGCVANPNEYKPQIDITLLDIPSIMTDWDRAHGVAKQMDTDSYLSNIYVDVALPESKLRTNSSISYRFLSHSNDYVSYRVNCDVLLCRRSQTDHEPKYPVEKTEPIYTEDIQISAYQAYKIGLSNLSNDFILTEYSTSLLALFKDAGKFNNQAYWVVTFNSNMFSDPTQYEKVIVNAASGEVLSIEVSEGRDKIPPTHANTNL